MLAMFAVAFAAGAADPLPGMPRIFIWAWERPENLESLDPKVAGVAFLARTVYLHRGEVTVRPRVQPLRYAPGTMLMAVVRVESSGKPLPPAATAAEAMVDAAKARGVRALQIDYDAVASERAFYREVLGEVRRRLPSSQPLSITALASWCASDRWLAGLPVDEAVPMLFRMGRRAEYPGTRDPLCASSAGVATDEPLASPPRGRRIYIFSPRPWSKEDLRTAVHEVSRWQ